MSSKHNNIERIHSFMLDTENKTAAFYIVHDYSDRNHGRTREIMRKELNEYYPGYTFIINSGMNI